MKYLNVSLLGLRGKLHPSVTNIYNTHSVKKMRPHIKMLAGNYLTFEDKSQQSGGSPFCKICIEPESENPETLEHLIASCDGLSEIRTNIVNEIKNLCQQAMCQFILDPSSIHLETRVNIAHPILPALFQLSRDYCYAIDRKRTKLLQ